jgi:hypothetical protein
MSRQDARSDARHIQENLMSKIIAAGLAATLIATGANAAITGGTTVSGTAFDAGSVFVCCAAPAQVGLNRLESLNVFGWNEETAVLADPLAVNWLASTGMAGVLAAGTKVHSFGIAFDPDGTPGLQPEVSGFITFNRPVLAVITQNPELVASDFLGKPATSFDSTPNRGLEEADFFSLSMDGLTLTYHFRARNPGDNIRVLTAVPEPATWAMLIAGFGMVGFAARRRKAAIA